MRPLDISGERYGRLTALEFTGRHRSKTRLWLCRCDCGTLCEVMLSNLRSGHSRSCGCTNRDHPPRKKLDLAGHRCGRLVVLEITPRKVRSSYLWLCRCDCGKTVEVSGSKLRNGHTRSCGCLRVDQVTTQGGITTDPGTRVGWKLWHGVVRRCCNEDDRGYPNYGGRGIAIYSEWRESPWRFVEWLDENLGPRPKGYSLDRIDNDGNYEPGNLRWASRSTQQRNRRHHIYVRGAEAEKLRAYAASVGITPAQALSLAIERLAVT